MKCVEGWTAYTSNQTQVPDGTSSSQTRQPGAIRVNGKTSFYGPMKLFYTEDFAKSMGDSSRTPAILEKYRYDKSYWIYGTDGGIYYPYDVQSTYTGADTMVESWWYMGYCILKYPD